MTELYDIPVMTIDGEAITLTRYRGKALLIVNVASRCGFTPQYEGLEALYRKYKDRGFVVLGFPVQSVRPAGARQRSGHSRLLRRALRRHVSAVREDRRERPQRASAVSAT